MFNLRNFIKTGLIKAAGSMADYQIILNAAGWLEKGVLTEDDLAEIEAAIAKEEEDNIDKGRIDAAQRKFPFN